MMRNVVGSGDRFPFKVVARVGSQLVGKSVQGHPVLTVRIVEASANDEYHLVYGETVAMHFCLAFPKAERG